MKKQNIMPVAVLTVICVIVAALLAAVNMLTAPVVADRNNAAISASLGEVMQGGQFNSEPDELKSGAPDTVKEVYTEKTGMGTVVVLLTNKGYTGKNIGLTVGIDADGKITGMKITQNEESIVPAELKPGGTYGNHYVGAGAEDIPELSTGATVVYTEGAIKNALNDAFVYLGFSENASELPRDEEEIENLAKALYGEGANNLKSSTPEESQYVKRIYKEDGKSSFIAYAFSISQYGTPEFEFLIHVDEGGSIKAVEKILWKVSDAVPEWGYNPPSGEAVDNFFGSFVGKDSSTVPSVDVSTGATNTAGKVRDAAAEALTFFTPKIPRDVSEIKNMGAELYAKPGANLECIELDGYDYARLVLFERGQSSYIVYSLNYSRYGTPEFEFLTLVGEDGSIKGVKKILWKVSDAKPEWGYNPPSDATVDAFFASFVGKDSSTLETVDVSTGATNTATGVRDAATEALTVSIPNLPREFSEIKDMASELYAKPTANLECIELEGYDYAKLVFFEKGESSYIVYSINYSRYGTPEFEFLTLVGEDGSIKGIKKMLWKVSDAVPEWGYNPPSDATVDAFFASFVGKDSGTVETVDVSTGATNTATGVKDAALEALEVTLDKGDGNAPRIVGIVIIALAAVISCAFVIIEKKRRALK